MSMRILIIGGGVGGLYTAYYLLKKGVREDELTVISRERPYTRHRLAEVLRDSSDIHRTYLRIYDLLKRSGINIILGDVIDVRPGNREAIIDWGKAYYDRLVLATGGKPFTPEIPGVGLDNVLPFYSLSSLKNLISLRRGLKIAVIGAGFVGLTVASALHLRGHRVIVYEMMPYVLPLVLDSEPAKYVEDYLRVRGLTIEVGERLKELIGVRRVGAVRTYREVRSVDLVVLATGVRPLNDLALRMGLETSGGAVRIDRGARTGMEGIYALGDVALSHDYITGKEVYRPLGFIAAHYAKVAASNIAGGSAETQGVIPTIYESLLGLNVIRVGLSGREAGSLGLSPEVSCSKEGSRVECYVRGKGKDPLGYELVSTDFVRRNRAWDTYLNIKEAFRRD